LTLTFSLENNNMENNNMMHNNTWQSPKHQRHLGGGQVERLRRVRLDERHLAPHRRQLLGQPYFLVGRGALRLVEPRNVGVRVVELLLAVGDGAFEVPDGRCPLAQGVFESGPGGVEGVGHGPRGRFEALQFQGVGRQKLARLAVHHDAVALCGQGLHLLLHRRHVRLAQRQVGGRRVGRPCCDEVQFRGGQAATHRRPLNVQCGGLHLVPHVHLLLHRVLVHFLPLDQQVVHRPGDADAVLAGAHAHLRVAAPGRVRQGPGGFLLVPWGLRSRKIRGRGRR
jgi:hypothetical protein